MTGSFVVFEGIEGCGKTTQLQRTCDWLRSRVRGSVVVTREPGGTELGRQLRTVLLEVREGEPIGDRAELLLYAADRAQHVERSIKPQLASGAIVLCDRYTDSTVAYQGYGRQLNRELIDRLNHIATGGLEPDLTLWLDVEPEIGLDRARKRGEANRLEREALDFHRRVRQGYAALAQQYPHRIVRIDGRRSPDEVEKKVQQILTERLSLKLSGLELPPTWMRDTGDNG
ncbi:dTMP kinase [Baaleninema simplex]|uniref:dTMP kinase n=1 Tax=Baaleninema simplex TaxID=2862350 RepID=UPI000346C46F|nr:dTMP kinase [Baaleninema simplex]